MARSRKDRWEAEQREALAAQRIWPVWARTLGGMIEAGAAVRFACPACERLYDVDLEAVATLRGRAWSLIERRARCKASRCRTSGRFVAAAGPNEPFLWLAGGEGMPGWLVGARPSDHEPPPDKGPAPPAPPGVDGVRWAYANESERNGWCGRRGSDEELETRCLRNDQIWPIQPLAFLEKHTSMWRGDAHEAR